MNEFLRFVKSTAIGLAVIFVVFGFFAWVIQHGEASGPYFAGIFVIFLAWVLGENYLNRNN
jgi:hypothetical protein